MGSELRDDLVNGSGHLGDVLGLPALLEDPGNHLQEMFHSLLTFEPAPGSAPGIGGSHFLTLSCLFHQQPDRSYDFLSDKLDLDLRGKSRDVCSSDVDGEPNQADHKTGRS